MCKILTNKDHALNVPVCKIMIQWVALLYMYTNWYYHIDSLSLSEKLILKGDKTFEKKKKEYI